jgi:molecular chaperone DnaJ
MDVYAILGLSRTASDAEVERAYRRLSRQYHPGINPGDRVAEGLYRQIQDAYRVLMDADRRRQYDSGVTSGPAADHPPIAFEGFDFSAPVEGSSAATFSELFADVFQHAAREATTPTRGQDLELSLRLSFLDAARGAEIPLSVTRQARCPACVGHGRISSPPRRCPACDGEGTRRWARGHMLFTKPCEVCAATGQITADRCRHCGGVGAVARTEVLTIGVPAGVETGSRIAVPGHGHAGALGGPAGDLYATVEVADHPYFRRVGRDLVVHLPVAIHEAALGARVDVPALDGAARVRIPPGTPSGRRLRVRGRGLPLPGGQEAGDLIVEVQIVPPPELDDASKQLLREFGRLNDVDVRRHLFTDRDTGARA